MSSSRRKAPFGGSGKESSSPSRSRPSSRSSRSSSRHSTPTPTATASHGPDRSNNPSARTHAHGRLPSDMSMSDNFFQDPSLFADDVIDGAPPSSSAGAGAGHVRKKSITSGISTLFRRQPSPDPDCPSGGGGGNDDDRDGDGDGDGRWHANRERSESHGSGSGFSAARNSKGRPPPPSPSSKRPPSRGKADASRAIPVDPPSSLQRRPSSADARHRKKKSTSSSGRAAAAADSKPPPPSPRHDERDMVRVDLDPSFNYSLGDPSDNEASTNQPSPPPPPPPQRVLSPTFSSENGTEGTGMYFDDEGSSSYRLDGLGGGDDDENTASLDGEDDEEESAISRGKSRRDRERERDRDRDRDRDRHRDRRGRDKSRTSSSKRKKRKHTTSSQPRLPLRYRGFSTSISSLFLDESIVCGAISCCGLLLSSRTEYLLNERNVKRGLTRRGTKQGGSRAPSRILGVSLVLTIVLVVVSYVVWGFGTQYYYYYEDEGTASGGGKYNNNGNNDGGNNNNKNNYNNGNNDDGGNKNNNNLYYYDDGVEYEDEDQDALDDAIKNDDAQLQNDDDGVQADDDAAQHQGDDNVAQDDVVQAADDAVQQQQQQQLDDAVPSDDFYGMADDAVQRRLDRHAFRMGDRELESIPSKKRHSFNGIMKLRDYREHVVDPVIAMASHTYTDFMGQFDEDNNLNFLSSPSSTNGIHHHDHRRHDHLNRKLEGNYDNQQAEDVGQQVRTVIVVIFLFMLGVVGRRRRMRTRFAILRSRAQDDHLYYASLLTNASGSLATPDGTLMENFHEREDKYDGACSHTLFGCYPVDNQVPHYADYDDDDDDDEDSVDSQAPRKKRKGGDFMTRSMDAVFQCCCGMLCKCWCQLFSICALAQEAREARLLLPPKMQRVDLLTHQPFHEYAKDVNDVRRRYMTRASRTWVQHYAALSKLSRYILLGFFVIAALVATTMLVHGGFSWGDVMVLGATFIQSFLVLVIVFGIFHRSDLSLDAVIKFFAVGFVICVPVGFVIEGLLINIGMAVMYSAYYIIRFVAGERLDAWIIDNHYILWFVGELLGAYFVAALVEELCKYYGFRFIEHPDLLFLTGLDRTARQAQIQGGIDSYKFDSQIVSEFSRALEHEDDPNDRLKKRTRDQKKASLRNRDGDDDEEPELRSLQQQAAAITTGMISVAVGLACAENCLYVFFLGGTAGSAGVGAELVILLFRSIFPVHALSAAMQSINMIKKFIEEKHTSDKHVGVGKIVFPAILLHGTFDAILMSINTYIEAQWDRYYEDYDEKDDDSYEVPYNSVLVNIIAWVGIVGVMIGSFVWYHVKNHFQMMSLASIEQKYQSKAKRSGFDAPSVV
ncbi:hypothetical protein ACHAXS_008985 [Conticribra weissflogii]